MPRGFSNGNIRWQGGCGERRLDPSRDLSLRGGSLDTQPAACPTAFHNPSPTFSAPETSTPCSFSRARSVAMACAASLRRAQARPSTLSTRLIVQSRRKTRR